MAKRIIIATHAKLAKGFAESLRFIFEPEDRIDTICAFTDEGDPGKAFAELSASFQAEDTVIVCTDLSSGSVNKMIAGYLAEKKFYLVTGLNLALLLELAAAPEELIDEDFMREAVKTGQEDMQFVNDVIAGGEDEDGSSFF